MSKRIILCYLIFALSDASVRAFSQEEKETTNDVFLTGVFGGNYLGYHSFWIGRDKLPQKDLWTPGNQPFPMNLSAEVTRARTYLIVRDHITNGLDLAQVNIVRSEIRRNTTNDSASPDNWQSYWVVRLEYLEQNGLLPPSIKNVTMLLDGTYASERIQPKSPSDNHVHEARMVSTVVKTNYNTLEPSHMENGNPIAELQTADFIIPKVQWDPSYAFPLDLNAVATNAYNYLTQTNDMPEDYILHEISFSQYIPQKAIDVANDSVLNNWHHWVIDCQFAKSPSSRHSPIYYLYMLLDGRVLGVTEQDD